MTTLAGGSYAGTFNRKQPPSPKYWPPKYPKFEKSALRVQQVLDFGYSEVSLRTWLTECKHYGAEYYED